MPAAETTTQLEECVLKALKQHCADNRGVLSLSDISRISGVDVSLLSRIVSGERTGMSLSTAGKICRYLGLVLGRPAKPKQ